MGNPKVNLFVLDIEGYELAILRYNFAKKASEPINIHWIRTGSLPYCQLLYSIVLQTIFHEYIFF